MSKKWNEIAEKIIAKERAVAERNRGGIPYTTEQPHRFGDWSDPDRISWWTNGFWGGMMWQLFSATGEAVFRESAVDVEEKLDAVLMDYNGMDHDAGFRFLPTAVAHWRIDGNEASKNRGLLAAANLAGRFNPNGSFIRAWNDFNDGRDTRGWAIIDCMMNLPLLYWASDLLKDDRFKGIAVRHADTARERFIRADGSVRHIVGFDPATGEYLKDYGGQGMGEGSSWTRGQSWALYGFALSHLHTGRAADLETARKVADRFIERIPDDGLIPVDFDQEKDCPWRDDTAAAIASCGLLTLAKLTEEARYRDAAERLLAALDEKEADYDPEHDELLTRGTAAYHDKNHDFPIIYGDYYYIEAIWKLTEKELFLW